MFFELIDRRPTLSIGMSVDSRPTPRAICYDRLSVVHPSTIGGVSIERLKLKSCDRPARLLLYANVYSLLPEFQVLMYS